MLVFDALCQMDIADVPLKKIRALRNSTAANAKQHPVGPSGMIR